MFTCHLGPVCRGKACWPHLLGQPGTSTLPIFAFGNKLVYKFLSRVLGSCPCCTVGPMFLPSWAQGSLCCCKWRASVKCQKEESSRDGGHPCRAGGHPHRAGPVKKQKSASCRPACSLVPDCSAVTWALGSILLEFGFFPLGGLVGFCFLSLSPDSVGREWGDAHTPLLAV